MEDSRNSKVSSVPLGADVQAAKATTGEVKEVAGHDEEGEEETGEKGFFFSFQKVAFTREVKIVTRTVMVMIRMVLRLR